MLRYASVHPNSVRASFSHFFICTCRYIGEVSFTPFFSFYRHFLTLYHNNIIITSLRPVPFFNRLWALHSERPFFNFKISRTNFSSTGSSWQSENFLTLENSTNTFFLSLYDLPTLSEPTLGPRHRPFELTAARRLF